MRKKNTTEFFHNMAFGSNLSSNITQGQSLFSVSEHLDKDLRSLSLLFELKGIIALIPVFFTWASCVFAEDPSADLSAETGTALGTPR